MPLYFQDLDEKSAIKRRVKVIEIDTGGVFYRIITGKLIKDERGYAIDPENIEWSNRAQTEGIPQLLKDEPRPIRLGSYASTSVAAA